MTNGKTQIFDAMRPVLAAGRYEFNVSLDLFDGAERLERFTRSQILQLKRSAAG
jgi:hypothetical protein